MAAYAAVVSLMNTIDQILNHRRLSASFDNKQVESLHEKTAFLLDFIERYNSHGAISKEPVADLESRIASAAHEAEDVIESHIVHQIRAGESSTSLLDLQEVMENVDSISEMIKGAKEKWVFTEKQPTYLKTATFSRSLYTSKNTMVGFDDSLIQLLEMLTGQSLSRQVIPIVGMGGMGKTMLARNVYENLLVLQYFDIRAWATISQEYSIRDILLELLSCLGKSTGETVDEKLGEQLYKKLCGKRYLIILDDIWIVEVWDKIKLFFPDNGNGSRIVVTTRLSNMSTFFGSYYFEMNFLDEIKSWNLFCGKAFGSEDCPPELEKIGKKIVQQCKGLPLSIVVIGGLLRNLNKRKEYWEKVAENINSVLSSGEDEQCMNVLSLSYSHLPPHLKPCFLYLGVFREDVEIHVSQLINLWVAEGFLKPNKAQSLEEVAESYLKDLIERNLVLVHRLRPNKSIKTCGIHDLLRELCLRVAQKEKFIQDMRVLDIPQGMAREWRRIVLQGGVYHRAVGDALKSASLARSLIHERAPLPDIKFSLPFNTFPILRVLTNADGGSLQDILYREVNLRYLTCEIDWVIGNKLPSSISLLWNLQTLIIRRGLDLHAPSEIWEMQQLRHLNLKTIYLPRPPQSETVVVLRNLQTLKKVENFRLSEAVCKRIPNIRKLHISYLDDFRRKNNNYCLKNLCLLHGLESLNLDMGPYPPQSGDLVRELAFPSLLRKLSLHRCRLNWEHLTRIGFLLPHLEVLKLPWGSAVGPRWEPVEGAFPRLKLLKIGCTDLIYWTADNSHFPVLEELILQKLEKLHEIPLDIAGIPTLGCIRLDCCSMTAAISAAKILEEQLSLGNEDFRLRVEFFYGRDKKRFLEEVEVDSFTSKNFVCRAHVHDKNEQI